jgi:hypothetical protein
MNAARVALLLLALPATMAVAQSQGPVVVRQLASPPAAARAAAAIDQDQVVQRRLKLLGQRNRLLESRVATLEETLREMRARTEYTCTGTTSVNGRGDSDECSPFACNYLDGRCRTSAAKSDHCAPGYLWDGGNRCVAPPPAEQEQDCGFLGLGCL